MVFPEKPKDFNPWFTVATCYIEHDGKFLLVQRNDDKFQGGKWGVPGGKVEPGETEPQALIRELKEEIGIDVPEERLHFLQKVFIRFPERDFEMSMFSLKLDRDLEVALDTREHQAYKWATMEQALAMDLIHDNGACLKIMAKLHAELP